MYKNSLVTVKCQIRQAENPTTAVVIRVGAACVDNGTLVDYLTSKVVVEEPEIGSTDQNIPINNNCPDDQRHFMSPGGSGDFAGEGDDSDECEASPTASW